MPPLQITFELSDDDLEFFRAAMHAAQERIRGREESEILAAARRLARSTTSRLLPEFVTERLQSLDGLTRMVEDADWQLEADSRTRVFQALAYFAAPSDLIPDQIPGLGFLDDAIMVQLVVQELQPEVDAYAAFCRQREAELERQGLDAAERQRRIQESRRAMVRRMEERRSERARRGGTFSIFR